MKASDVIAGARKLLVDPTGVRWPDSDLLGWVGEAQLQVIAVRPDSNSKRADLTLVAGIEQTIPADGTRLLSVLQNVGGRVITLISRNELSSIDVNWPVAAARSAQRHYMFDADTPKVFEVWPPAVPGNKARIAYAAIPAPIAAPTDDLTLDGIYLPSLTDWVCYRAYMQDSDDPQDGGRAANHLAAFMQALTGKSQSDVAYEPKRK